MNALPLRGPERVAAVRDLRRALADDMVGTARMLTAEGWRPEDIAWVVDCHAAWLHQLVDGAHDEAVGWLDWAGVTS